MRAYLELLAEVRRHGTVRDDRTGVGTRSLFGRQLRFDLGRGFPLVTTKRCAWKAIVCELLWFLRGETNVKSLQQQGVGIWDEWALDNGDLGPMYGAQWRSWETADGGTLDQMAELVAQIRQNPDSRRLVVSAWNPAVLPRPGLSPQDNVRRGLMALAPCHCLFQFYVAHGRLSCQLYQRSADLFLGVPFNIASYSLLCMMLAQVCGLAPGEFVHCFGDVHIYNNHLRQVDEQLGRAPMPPPQVELDGAVRDIFAFDERHIRLVDYRCHPPLPAPVAV